MKPLNHEERIRVSDNIGFEAMDRIEKINENLNKLMDYLGLAKVMTSFEESKIVRKPNEE